MLCSREKRKLKIAILSVFLPEAPDLFGGESLFLYILSIGIKACTHNNDTSRYFRDGYTGYHFRSVNEKNLLRDIVFGKRFPVCQFPRQLYFGACKNNSGKTGYGVSRCFQV